MKTVFVLLGRQRPGAGVAGLHAALIRLLAVGMVLIGTAAARAVEVRVVLGGESAAKAVDCRRMLVGPGVNQPDPHPGYAGFVGWDAPLRLRDGTLLVSFSTGYWHASPPTPLRVAPDTLVTWRKLGMPTNIDAPRGGRAMLIRSTDNGRTWSKPRTIIDTPWDDRSPAMVELPDGTLVCSFFTYPGEGDLSKQPDLACRTGIICSRDGGKTWEQTPRRLPSPFVGDATDGPPLLLKDGSLLLAAYGAPKQGMAEQVGMFRSTDGGRAWQLLSVVKSGHEMSESGLAQLPDGRLVMISRPEGDIAWSSDGGRTWTKPVTFGMRMFEPGLLMLRDGTLLCLHGSYGGGGFRAIFSGDGGKTWRRPPGTTDSRSIRPFTVMGEESSCRMGRSWPFTFTLAATARRTPKRRPSGRSGSASGRTAPAWICFRCRAVKSFSPQYTLGLLTQIRPQLSCPWHCTIKWLR